MRAIFAAIRDFFVGRALESALWQASLAVVVGLAMGAWGYLSGLPPIGQVLVVLAATCLGLEAFSLLDRWRFSKFMRERAVALGQCPSPVQFEVLETVETLARVQGSDDEPEVLVNLELLIDNLDSRILFVTGVDFAVVRPRGIMPFRRVPLGRTRSTLSATFETSDLNDTIHLYDKRGVELQPGSRERYKFYVTRSIEPNEVPRLTEKHFVRVRFAAMGQPDTIIDLSVRLGPRGWEGRRGNTLHPMRDD